MEPRKRRPVFAVTQATFVVLGLLYTLVLPVRLQAQASESLPAPVILTDDRDRYPLGKHLEILADPTGALTADDVQSPAYAARFAPSRLKYFAGFGWLDLASGLPGLPILRLARVPTLMRLARQLNRDTPEDVRRDAHQRLASGTLLSTILVVLLVVTVGSILIVLVEKDAPGGNIVTGDDAVWWSIVTIATVGYGDRYPTTPEGRLIGVLMIVVGVSLFSVLTSFIATNFVSRRRRAEDADEIDWLRKEIAALFSEQQLRDQRELSALRVDLTEMRSLIEELKASPDREGRRES